MLLSGHSIALDRMILDRVSNAVVSSDNDQHQHDAYTRFTVYAISFATENWIYEDKIIKIVP